ncbi:hypothetical protein SeMB42_g01156 [Synchytrium endobioticum]|uniref:Uncharacterized protein n=1 Tax=Synchytrium endobioticum TaxID=286115 RepID=A0A507CJJ6_9FUNG|nr:hypothetical protein SeLEV6574_g06989 [Synchytrium endobioticum]TPX52825.1 hypothetical protein SeMB42_g01156 [Synchytrium endobioticum]
MEAEKETSSAAFVSSSNQLDDADNDDDTASFYSVPEDADDPSDSASTSLPYMPPNHPIISEQASTTPSTSRLDSFPDQDHTPSSHAGPWSVPPITEVKSRMPYPARPGPTELEQLEAEMDLSAEEVAALKAKALDEKELGNVHFKNAEYDEAIGRYQNALDICPIRFRSERAIFNSNLAACHFLKQRWDDVVKSCTKAIDLNPDYIQAIRRRASANEKLNRSSSLSAALEDYKKLLQLDPNNKEAAKAIKSLPPRIQVRQEEEKEEMMGKLKDLGNQFLGMFGLSTDNFQMKQDPATGNYAMNFQK